MLRKWVHALDEQKSAWDRLRQLGKLPPPPSRLPRGKGQLGQSHLLFRTEHRNLATTPTIFSTSSPPNSWLPTSVSSSSILPPGISFVEDNKSYSPTLNRFLHLYTAIVIPDGSNMRDSRSAHCRVGQKFAIASMPENVEPLTVAMNTHAWCQRPWKIDLLSSA